jgi:hypothetical protein
MNGFDDGDAELLERGGRALAVLFAGAAAVCLVGWLLAGCTPAVPLAVEGQAYREERVACREQNATCPGFVACMRRVEAAHGRTYAGRCEP